MWLPLPPTPPSPPSFSFIVCLTFPPWQQLSLSLTYFTSSGYFTSSIPPVLTCNIHPLTIIPPDNCPNWQFPHLTITLPDNYPTWQLPYLTIIPPDNCPPWQLPHLTIDSPDNYPTWHLSHQPHHPCLNHRPNVRLSRRSVNQRISLRLSSTFTPHVHQGSIHLEFHKSCHNLSFGLMGLSKVKSEDLLKELPAFPLKKTTLLLSRGVLCLHTDCMIQLQAVWYSWYSCKHRLYDTTASTVWYSCKLHVWYSWYSCKRHNAEFFLPTSGCGATVSDNLWQFIGYCEKRTHFSIVFT